MRGLCATRSRVRWLRTIPISRSSWPTMDRPMARLRLSGRWPTPTRAAAIGQFRYPESLRIMNEWLFEIDCVVTSGLRWASLPQVLGRYRVHQQQTSSSREASMVGFEESMQVLAMAGARYPELAILI